MRLRTGGALWGLAPLSSLLPAPTVGIMSVWNRGVLGRKDMTADAPRERAATTGPRPGVRAMNHAILLSGRRHDCVSETVPLDVVWQCRRCHLSATCRRSEQSKLTVLAVVVPAHLLALAIHDAQDLVEIHTLPEHVCHARSNPVAVSD